MVENTPLTKIETIWKKKLSNQFSVSPIHIEKTVGLLDEGATIPFIARYRKEITGSLDEVQIAAIRDILEKDRELERRKSFILQTLDDRDLLTEELTGKIHSAQTVSEVEDLYLPYKQKKKTRAAVAKEKGFAPVAHAIINGKDPASQIKKCITRSKGSFTHDEVVAGARDIIAEWVSEDVRTRSRLRSFFADESVVTAKVIEKKRDQAQKYADYFDFQEPVGRIPGHRILALFRGENEKCLRITIAPPEDKGISFLRSLWKMKNTDNDDRVFALDDSYKRLLQPSLENELRKKLKEKADDEAIDVFCLNVQKLLLFPPLGRKSVMALDPGYRTGAKLVCLDDQGRLLHNETVYPTQGAAGAQKAGERIRTLVEMYAIEAIAIGDGTAGRETETFIHTLGLADTILVTLVNEDGASIYSASETAREEFPDEDITVRGAVSIGRRLQDPLAELVKIDPKSIGVGQYQHDVNQTELKKGLNDVVVFCVNRVGVEINTASKQLLTHVAGLGDVLAENIVAFRGKNGPFSQRKDLLKVPRLGPKAFEQSAGFLRIRGGDNPLDNTGVHPERYALLELMAKDSGSNLETLLQSSTVRNSILLNSYVTEDVGLETLKDIYDEIEKPGRDPREKFAVFRFDDRVHCIEDLEEGMILPARITNVTTFGAFADIGIKQDGLIHISQLADRFVKDPAKIVSVRDTVTVKVTGIDISRKRISLSMRLT